MAEYKSEVKTVYANQECVFEKLADLNNLSVIQERLDDPNMKQAILQQAGDKVKPEQMDEIVERLRSLRFDTDSVTANAAPLGDVTLRIIEREAPKCLKFELQGVPMQANLWIQLLPATECQCAMRVTVRADLNFFLKQMVGNKLQQGVDGLAQMLASLPY